MNKSTFNKSGHSYIITSLMFEGREDMGNYKKKLELGGIEKKLED